MSSHEDDHGSTPAAWTAVIIMLVGMSVSGCAMWFNAPAYFWVGMAMVGAGAVTGWIMAKAGLGQPR